MQPGGFFRGLGHVEHNLARIEQKLLPGGGQLHAAIGARQQSRANLLLQQLDLLAKRRLGDIQARGCAAKVQLFGNGNKVAQMTEFDIHILNISFYIINILDIIIRISYP